jgi:hypothetical protein
MFTCYLILKVRAEANFKLTSLMKKVLEVSVRDVFIYIKWQYSAMLEIMNTFILWFQDTLKYIVVCPTAIYRILY